MKQRLLFVLPEGYEALMAAMAAIRLYVVSLTAQRIRLEVILVTKVSWVTDLVIPLQYIIYENKEDALALGHFDLAVEFLENDAKAIAYPSGKSAATAFGIMLGFEAIGELPKLISDYGETTNDLCIIPWGNTAYKLFDTIKRSYPDLRVILSTVNDEAAWESISNCEMVIGVRSIYTYLAASAKRAVIDIYPEDQYERSFYAKWSSGKYQMLVVEDTSQLDSERIYLTLWKSFERLYKNTFSRRLLMRTTNG